MESIVPPRSAGIDWGAKHTGFAITDALRPRQLPGDSEALLDRIASLLDERVIDTFALGLPLHMDASEGPCSPPCAPSPPV